MAIVGYYRFNGNSNDASGNGNNGTDTDITYSQSNGLLKGGAGFNGSTSKIIISYSTSINIVGNIWINAIVKFNSLPASGKYAVIISRDYELPNNNVGYFFDLYNNSGTYQLRVGSYKSSPNPINFGAYYNFTPTTGKFYILSGNYDNEWKLYIDGNLLNASSYSNVQGAVTDGVDLSIGIIDVSGYADRQINGSIDEIKLHSGIIYPANVKNEYSRIKGFF